MALIRATLINRIWTLQNKIGTNMDNCDGNCEDILHQSNLRCSDDFKKISADLDIESIKHLKAPLNDSYLPSYQARYIEYLKRNINILQEKLCILETRKKVFNKKRRKRNRQKNKSVRTHQAS